jgi:hypothetical protein
MLTYLPPIVNNIKTYEPLLKHFNGVMITAGDLAQHWGYTEAALAQQRKNGRGLPFIKLPTGGVRYNQAEIIAAELGNTSGPLTIERVCQSIAACEDVSPGDRLKMRKHIRAAFSVGGQ